VTQITDLQAAVQELRAYLSDRIAPLMVLDSMGLLLEQPASLLATEIAGWATQQQAEAPDVPAVDFLYHGVKKVTMLAELDLVSKDSFAEYLPQLAYAVVRFCPESDRNMLRESLSRLGLAVMAPSSAGGGQVGAVDVLHRAAGSAARAAEHTPTSQAALGLRRLSLFLQRLQPQAPMEKRAEVMSQFVATAATHSRTSQELDEHLSTLRERGIETAMDELIRTLARALPGWGSLSTAGPSAAPAVVAAEADALRQLVTLAEDPAEGAKRFRHLVQSAIEQFNEGNLGRAVTMYELAEQLAADKKVDAVFVDALRQGHEPLHYERLRKYAERADTRAGLRTVMNFYHALRVEGLLDALDGEPERSRRHELLALLEAHEQAARAKAYELLKTSVEKTDAGIDPFFQMNLVYLLRVIPRPKDAPFEEEVSLVIRAPGRSSPPPLVKQVIAYLGFTRHEQCERGLITYLRLFENMLLQPESAVYTPAELETLLDRTCAALARYATPRAWRALIDHGLKTEVKLGSPTARLVEAGRQDLSSAPELVEKVIAALRAETQPKSLMALFTKNEDRIIWLIQALSGTATAEVQAVLQEIADKHPNQRYGQAAAKALVTLGSASRPATSSGGLSGDLDLFGLPGLLQTLSGSNVTGALSLMNIHGQTEAAVLLEEGKFRGAQYKHLKRSHALYQLLERPFPGTFNFIARGDVGALPPAAPPQELMGLLLEGVRRHDEFKRASTLVPDEAALRSAGKPPTPLDGSEPELAKALWGKVLTGAQPTQCDASINRDSYEIRRLLAHWVEEGSLALA
jgi:hypothetical protein